VTILRLLWCARCQTRFDLHVDELDPTSEVVYCPRCQLPHPVEVGRFPAAVAEAG